MRITRHIQWMLAMAAAGGLLASASHAQQAAPESTLEKIQITGSSIRRTDAETPSPVQVITAEDLKKSGYTTISEVLQKISANNQGTLSQSFNGAFAAGASGVALRGLTVGATLVLIDGHRSAPYPLSDDGQRSFVDISAIPFDAIDHVEILKDGASAIYGSDAIAGVVNVILKKSFSGTRINAEAGVTGHGDGRTTHLSLIHGAGDYDADGHNGFFSAEYRHQEQILVVNRPGVLTLRDYTPFGGVNATPGVSNAVNAGLPDSIGGYVIDHTTGLASTQLGCQATNALGPNCPYGINNALQVQPGTRNVNLLGKFAQKLADSWKLDLTASMFSSSAEQVGGIANTGGQGGLYGISAGPGVPIPTAYPASGPLLVTIPGTSGDILQTSFLGIGPQHTLVDTSTYRFIAEVSGEKWGWNLDATAGYNKAILHAKNTGYVSIPGVASLLAANPTATAAQLNAVLQSPANSSIISPLLTSTSTSDIDYINIHGDREIATLPGGPLELAVGAEYTHHALNTLAPGPIASGLVANGNDSFAVGQQNIASAYMELTALVLKNLEIDPAIRYDHVDTYGSSTTPKVGIKYTPVEQLILRGTYAQGFRAPNPAESGVTGQAFYYATLNDPKLCPGGGNLSTDIASQCNITPTFYQESNPRLQPEKSHSYTLGLVFEPVHGDSIAVDYYQIKLDNQITSAINAASPDSLTPNAVRGPTGQTFVNVGGTSVTPAYGLIEFIPTPYLNANSLKTTGVDIDVAGTWDLRAYGKISTDLNYTRVFKYQLTSPLVGTVELAGTHGPSGISGDTGTPKNRAVWTISWDKGPVDITSTLNYVSGYNATDPASGYNDCASAIDANYNGTFAQTATPTANTCNVSSFITVDFSGRYEYDKHWTVYGAIINAFDRAPPLDLETYGAQNYNPSLHTAGAVGRFFSVGLTYDF